MAKVVIFRESGNAVNKIEAAKMKAEYQEKFDLIQEEVGLDMMKMHDRLKELDVELQEKYEVITRIDMPQSRKKMQKFIEEYGNIELGLHPEHGVYIKILDLGGI